MNTKAPTAQKQAQSDIVLERVMRLHPKIIDLGLDRVERLLDRLGHPERDLPPVVHVAGTNGKGSVIAIDRVKEAGLPFIVLLTDPTTGGVTASFAMLGDIHVSEPGAQIGFAGARVIEETIREKLPDGFQRAEYLLDHGIIDLVVARKDLPRELGKIIGLLTRQPKPAAA